MKNQTFAEKLVELASQSIEMRILRDERLRGIKVCGVARFNDDKWGDLNGKYYSINVVVSDVEISKSRRLDAVLCQTLTDIQKTIVEGPINEQGRYHV